MANCPKYLQEGHIDVEMSFQWMKYTRLKGETEGLIIAVQDQTIEYKITQLAYYQKGIY